MTARAWRTKSKKWLIVILLLVVVFLLAGYFSLKLAVSALRKEQQLLLTDNLRLNEELRTCQETMSKRRLCCEQSIEIKTNQEGGYVFCVNGEPFLAKGVGYRPTPIGKGYDYDFFSDPNKPWLIDGKLMQEAGINCVRIYAAGEDIEKVKEFIRDMYEKFGIYTIMSDWLGLWDYPCANYADKEFCKRTIQRVLKIVDAIKDEKGLLMWILGNENNFTFSGKIGFWTSPEIEAMQDVLCKQRKRAEIYYLFVNELAKEIKKIDRKHPIALGNGEVDFLDVAARVASDIDVLAIITYRGKKFNNLFGNIRNVFDKPVLISEFGCDSYNAYTNKEDQDAQVEFLRSQWEDLFKNSTFSGKGDGNSIGGCIFEWNDEWWKHNEGYRPDWSIHNTEAGWSQGSYFFDIRAANNMNMNEEWFGIVSLSEEIQDGLNKRVPKKSYYVLKDLLKQFTGESLKQE